MVIEPLANEPWADDDMRSYQLPDGSSVTLWIASDYRLSEWSYIWASFDMADVPSTWYRFSRVSKDPPEWQPMKSVKDVFRTTGFRSDEGDDDSDAQLGGAEKLAIGRYVAQAKVRVGGEEFELRGLEFRVLGGPMPGGRG